MLHFRVTHSDDCSTFQFFVSFFCSSDCDFDVSKKKGKPFNYITYGVGCSEVEIDCLTGDHTVCVHIYFLTN